MLEYLSRCKLSVFRYRHAVFSEYNSKESDLIFSNYIEPVMGILGHEYTVNEWRLIIESNKVCLTAVLFHNRNKFPSVLIAHAVNFKDIYETFKLLLTLIQYEKYK